MSPSRRIHVWLAALLVLLQSLWPAVHAYGHARQSAWPTDTAAASCCGAVHRCCGGRRDGDGPRTQAVERLAAPAHDCSICELLRGTREFHGVAAAAPKVRTGIVGSVAAPVVPAPHCVPLRRPSLPRAPPVLLV